MATKRQVDTYKALTDLVLKAIITLIVLGCFAGGFVFVIYLIYSNHPWQNTALIAAIDALIGISLPVILNHFFPKKAE
jgi:magnesium-transporting ATPase (P-type)